MWLSVVFNIICLVFVRAANNVSRQEIISHLIAKSRYDANIVPDFNKEEATQVGIQITIHDMHSVSETTMDYSIDMFLRQWWRDERLDFTTNNTVFDKLELDPKNIENVWQPDTYFENEKRAMIHTVTTTNRLMHIYRNGTVVYSMRVAMTLSCTMLLHKYPFDSQRCPLILQSFGYTMDNIDLSWRVVNPFTINNVEMPQFVLSSDVTISKAVNNLQSGSLADTTIQILEADGRFITLTNLLKQTKLDSVLNGGNFTVFAPTDDAFKKIPMDDLSAITTDDTMLQAVLKYHVLVGSVKKLFISNEHIVRTVNGATARFNDYQHNNKVTIQGCEIIEFNKVASNGIVHVLDTVMTPPTGNIVDYLKSNKNLTKLVELATQAGILDELTRDSRTLFAPTNAAFANQFQDALNAIASDPVLLKNVLTYHVVGSTQYLKGLWNRERITTLFQGAQLVVHSKEDGQNLRIKNGHVIVGDVGTTNGVVHVVDHVLLSPTNAGTVG